ncbi:hypothetical protein ES703_84373 [subsurface metagenome]
MKLYNPLDDWLCDFNYDRNLCHEANFGVSKMYMANNQPFLKLKRRSGKEVTNVMDFLQSHWNKLFWLVVNMVRLSFWALRPNLKAVFLSKFVGPFEDK